MTDIERLDQLRAHAEQAITRWHLAMQTGKNPDHRHRDWWMGYREAVRDIQSGAAPWPIEFGIVPPLADTASEQEPPAVTAGSYNHCVAPDGQLLTNEQLQSMLENGDDVYEAIYEMYGMIWWLAYQHALRPGATAPWSSDEWVERARDSLYRGIDISPGINGHFPDKP